MLLNKPRGVPRRDRRDSSQCVLISSIIFTQLIHNYGSFYRLTGSDIKRDGLLQNAGQDEIVSAPIAIQYTPKIFAA
jgi:hypothetical protein